MRGSLTAWFPTRDTTQAGVVAEASSSASTASTPMRLACKMEDSCCLMLDKRGGIYILKDIYQDPVKGRRGAASLHVTQDGDPGVESQTAHDQLDRGRRGKIAR